MNKRKASKLLQTGLALTMLCTTLAIIFYPSVNLVRTVSHYSVHLMLSMLGLSMLFMIVDAKRLMFSALACTGLLSIWLKDASNSHMKLPEVNEKASLKVAHINLSNIENDFAEIKTVLLQEAIDIVSFQEYTPDWIEELESLSTNFPYTYDEVRIDPYGMAVLSRKKLVHADTISCSGIPSICMEIENENKHFHIVSTYLAPALDNNSLEVAGRQLDRLTSEVKESKHPVIALGEYNMTYWSPEIRKFRSETQLQNSRRDVSQGNLRVPYDHIFYSEGLECVEFKEIKDKSDKHVGIMGTYQIKSDTKLATWSYVD